MMKKAQESLSWVVIPGLIILFIIFYLIYKFWVIK